jgi:hypothetical protein
LPAPCATHLLVFWEETDLHTSLRGPAEGYPLGLAMLQADYRSHQLDWYPFDASVRRYRPTGGADLDITWGTPSTCPSAALHQPVSSLLSWSRDPDFSSRSEVDQTLASATAAGCDIAHFAAPVSTLAEQLRRSIQHG